MFQYERELKKFQWGERIKIIWGELLGFFRGLLKSVVGGRGSFNKKMLFYIDQLKYFIFTEINSGEEGKCAYRSMEGFL